VGDPRTSAGAASPGPGFLLRCAGGCHRGVVSTDASACPRGRLQSAERVVVVLVLASPAVCHGTHHGGWISIDEHESGLRWGGHLLGALGLERSSNITAVRYFARQCRGSRRCEINVAVLRAEGQFTVRCGRWATLHESRSGFAHRVHRQATVGCSLVARPGMDADGGRRYFSFAADPGIELCSARRLW